MKSYKTIRVEKKEGIGYLTLNRPEVRNAFNQEMIDEIREALRLMDKDEEIRLLIITGAGKAFQAGADIAELSAMKPMDLLRWNEGIVRINAALEKLHQPAIARSVSLQNRQEWVFLRSHWVLSLGLEELSAYLALLERGGQRNCFLPESQSMLRRPIGSAW